jgi:hypothetical protein
MEKEFNYSASEKGLLLAAFFIGYIFPQVSHTATLSLSLRVWCVCVYACELDGLACM